MWSSLSLLLTVLIILHATASAAPPRPPSKAPRKTVLNNIISNYFGTDPFFKSKSQKVRLHLPRRPPGDQGAAPSAPRPRPPAPSSWPPAPPAPQPRPPVSRPVRLGPPIRILPSGAGLAGRLTRPPTSFQHGRGPASPSGGEIVTGRIPAPLLAGLGRRPSGEEAPLLGRRPPLAGAGSPARGEVDTFSQLISRTQVSIMSSTTSLCQGHFVTTTGLDTE